LGNCLNNTYLFRGRVRRIRKRPGYLEIFCSDIGFRSLKKIKLLFLIFPFFFKSAYFPFSYVKPEQNYLEGEALEGHRVQQLQQQRQQVLLFPQHHQRQHSSNNNGQQQQQIPLNFEEELEERPKIGKKLPKI